jgi:hypothetical protein
LQKQTVRKAGDKKFEKGSFYSFLFASALWSCVFKGKRGGSFSEKIRLGADIFNSTVAWFCS